MTATDWDEIGDRHYRKREIYTDLQWLDESGQQLKMSEHVIVGSAFAGPIAFVPDERRRSQMHQLQQITFCRIFSPSATLISHFRWTHRGLIKLGWSEEESLVVVLENGTIVLYDIRGHLIRTFSMGTQCENTHIADAYIFGSGVVVRTAGDYFQLWAVMDFNDPVPFSLCDPKIERPPVFMTGINPDINTLAAAAASASQEQKHGGADDADDDDKLRRGDAHDMEVLISTGDGGVYCVTRYKCSKLLQHRGGAIMRMCVSGNGRMIAILDENMNLIVSSRNFSQQASNFILKARSQPVDMQWCGSDAVVLVFNHDQIIVASSNEFIPYPYPPSLFSEDGGHELLLIAEIDCIRVITARSYEVLSIVPFQTQDIFGFGSEESASLLYDSYEDFEAGDARADHHRRKIADEQMEDAVIDCLEAAKYELEMVEFQTKLLRASKYGKLFLKNQDLFLCDQFVETCRFLRVLNNLRAKPVAMPLTYTQFEILTSRVVLERLIARKQHLLAIKCAKYLNLPDVVNRALEHWAICKIESASSSVSDRELVLDIRAKIDAFSTDFSYAKIARAAQQQRSSDLATLFLEFEPRTQTQVHSLIEFEQNTTALKKALASLDMNLIHETLIELIQQYHDRKTWFKLFEIIHAHNHALQNVHSDYDASSPYNTVLHNLLIQCFVDVLLDEYDSDDHYKALLHEFLTFSQSSSSYAVLTDEQQQFNLNLLASTNLKKALALILKKPQLETEVEAELERDDNQQFMQYLEGATVNFEKLRNKFNVSMCADLKRVTIFQRQFDRQMQDTFGDHGMQQHAVRKTVGLSVNETIATMLEMGQQKDAEKIKKEMFISEQRWWYILMNVYVKKREFEKLCAYIDKHTSSRRPPPIGYLPIIEAFLEMNEVEYAKRYILKIGDIDEKLEWLCQLKLWMDAVDVAVDAKDFDALQTIKHNCNDSKVVQRIQDLLNNLK